MYSLVLLTALSTGADVTPAPAAAPAVIAPVVTGCSGCCGYSMAYGCYGSSCSGCNGFCNGTYSAWSCHGGMFAGMFGNGGLFAHHHHHCHGCCGGYSSGCCGGYACCGGCGGYSGMGSTWGPPIGMPPYTLQGYNQGGMYGWGPPVIYGNVTNPNPPTTPVPTPPIPSSDTKPTTDPNKGVEKKSGAGATLKFQLPGDTKLYIDGRLIPVTGAERTFTTPPLEAGMKYFYDVKAELTVNGSPIVEERRVIVESGASISESFAKLFAATAESKPTAVAGK
jgi:uncharacterized protein (TIGR03000 family)